MKRGGGDVQELVGHEYTNRGPGNMGGVREREGVALPADMPAAHNLNISLQPYLLTHSQSPVRVI